MKNITINGDRYTFKKFEPFANWKADIYDLYDKPSTYKVAAYEEWKNKLDCIYGMRGNCNTFSICGRVVDAVTNKSYIVWITAVHNYILKED